jgi:alkanesulfonate monooxygenase SsuD/methylene tetrahydromethanopterin reductase-like flavin-dependent oxidoreductase (luciferase family)
VLNMPVEALRRSQTPTSFEPFTLLAALAAVTERIGLVATASTTFDEPYHVARRFASLDHLSNGRAGWNIVTTSNPDAALNFGRDDHMEHGDRYRRAREFHDVVTGLWDSWADDAFIRDQESGLFFDTEKLHVLDHKGEFLSVRGPLNIARPVQGWPVIVQAGASDAGRQLAAETAEVVFAAGSTLQEGQHFYADVKGRAERAGRSRGAGNRGDRTVEDADDLTDDDPLGRHRQMIATGLALLAVKKSGVLQFEQDRVQELLRDLVIFRDIGSETRSFVLREMQHRLQSVLGLIREHAESSVATLSG